MSRLSRGDILMLKGQTVTFKVVNYGEDIKVKMVSYGEDAKFERSSFFGGREIKIRIVDYGEDVKLKHLKKMRSNEVRSKISQTMKLKVERGEFFTDEHKKNKIGRAHV